MRSILFYILSCIVFTNLSVAEVYRWTDENGNIQFGDNPDQTQAVEQLEIPIFKEADPVYLKHLQQQKKYLNARQEERQKKTEIKAKENSLKKERALKCKAAQDRLKIFTDHARVYVKEKGERRYLNSNEFSVSKQRANDEVMTFCK